MNGPNLAYTPPPPDLVMPHVIQIYMIAVFGGGAIVLAIYATYVAVTRKSLSPTLFLFAGWITVLMEPIADVTGDATYPPISGWRDHLATFMAISARMGSIRRQPSCPGSPPRAGHHSQGKWLLAKLAMTRMG